MEMFKLENIKAGMLVEAQDIHNTCLCLVLPNNVGELGISGKTIYMDLFHFNKDLDTGFTKINKIYGWSTNAFGYECSTNGRKLLWDRDNLDYTKMVQLLESIDCDTYDCDGMTCEECQVKHILENYDVKEKK